MKESTLQNKILTFLESRGAYAVKVIAASKSGVPDILVCYGGRFIGIEVKAPGKLNEVSELQKYNLNLIKKAYGQAYLVDSLDAVRTILETQRQIGVDHD